MAYRIKGGFPLVGEIEAQGSKNAALPILFAALLSKEPITLLHFPDIGDTRTTLALLGRMGVWVEKREGSVTLCAENVSPPSAYAAEITAMRASSYLLGAGLSRFGGMEIAYPGGCNLGARPLDLHALAFTALGADIVMSECAVRVSCPRMRGAVIVLSYPSVGATVNAVLAALGADGVSHVFGYAKEPHIRCFLRFLQAAGASLSYDEEKITVRGGVPLHGCTFSIDCDEVEAGTYLIAAAACGGSVTVKGKFQNALDPLLQIFDGMGIPKRKCGDAVTVNGVALPKRISVLCEPFPGFPTDLHPVLVPLLARCGGMIRDSVWQGRFQYVAELEKTGLRAAQREDTLSVLPSRLRPANLWATDLRGGAAMLVAALMATGESCVNNTHLIERGYENVCAKWRALGAKIEDV